MTVVLAATIVAVVVAAVADELAAVDSNSVDGAVAADYADTAVDVVAHVSVILADSETVTDFVNAVGDPVPIKTDVVVVVNFVVVVTFVAVAATEFVAAVVADYAGHVTETAVAHVTVSLPVNAVQIVSLEGAGVRIAVPGSLTVVAEAAVHHCVAYDALVVAVVVVKVGPHSAVVANGGQCTEFVAMTVAKSDVGFVVAVVVETVVVGYSVVPLDAVVLFVESAAAVWQAGSKSLVLTGSNSPLKPRQLYVL